MRALWAALSLLALGCSSRATPTYEADVRPLLERRCVRCHDGSARSVEPPLVTREQATRVSRSIARTVRAREMPPWGPDETGLCGTYRGDGWLSKAEIKMLTAWDRAGAPPGARVAKTGSPREASRAAPAAKHVSFAASRPFSPRLGEGASRCFLVDAPAHDVTATAMSSSTGHGLSLALFTLLDDGAVAAARAAEAREQAPGFPCASTGPERGELLASWSYVSPRVALPKGAGLFIPAGRPLVLHARADLTLLGLSASVLPRLELDKGDGERATLISLRARPRAESTSTKRAERQASFAVPAAHELLGVIPRMGSRGFSLEVAVVRGATRTCAAYFGHWHPALEQLYVREEPLALREGDRVVLTCAVTRGAAGEDDDDDPSSACAADLVLMPAP